MKAVKTVLAIGACAAATVAVYAAVLYSPEQGGWVGKGDVQLAFGWNNRQAQQYANDVTFRYDTRAVYDVTCEWETVTGGPRPQTIYHDVTVHQHFGVNKQVAYDARLKNQYTGYFLSPVTGQIGGGTPPQVGDSCPQAHETAVVTEVVATDEAEGLTVTFNGVTVPLPNTPVVVVTP